MKPLYSFAFVISILVALWVFISIGNPALHLNPWIGLIAWSAYFAGGGTWQVAKNTFFAGIVGILLTALTLYGVNALGGSLQTMMILIPILAFALVVMSQISSLAFTPAAFLAAAAFFGSGGNVDSTILFIILSWIAGICLGIASINIDKLFHEPAQG